MKKNHQNFQKSENLKKRKSDTKKHKIAFLPNIFKKMKKW